ncbi:hypothetical protein C6N75_09665 [Streptomyces solincola]|uniref:DUF7455 domain-containing protein n=1 Tax=Streptomyces solincola TaxID=2100817 RepID=A0A2S9PY57_9ACTN|nr:hypothetical protein [Streptomyces solincola]PRH79342.1 hypothetical protein C6N75_09665 [Streptomyces solincola]
MAGTLTAADRCDRCPAAAAYRVQKDDAPLALDFCGHHFRSNAADLYAEGWTVTLGNPDVVGLPDLEGTPS